jgi:endoglucanase
MSEKDVVKGKSLAPAQAGEHDSVGSSAEAEQPLSVRIGYGTQAAGGDNSKSGPGTDVRTGAPASTTIEATTRYHGVNLSGAEFGETALPGKLGTNYIFPTVQELDYYKQKGMNLVRVPFFWERMQPGLLSKNGADAAVDRSFDPVYVAQMESFLSAADARGIKVVLDAQQFGRFKGQIIGASNITTVDFKQFWGAMAQKFGQHACIYGYDLSNEPHDEDTKTWQKAAQAGLDGIRAAGDRHAVIVEGNNWASSADWNKYNSDLWVQDPANNVIYSAHSYWDANHSGRYNGGAAASYRLAVAAARLKGVLGLSEDAGNLGINSAKPFVEWLKKHNARGYIGEYGVPADNLKWIKVQDKFLSYARANNLDTTAWGGGPWWPKDNPLSLEKGPAGEKSVTGPEKENLKSVVRDGKSSF